MDELIEQFAIEARELVQQASEDLLSLEAAPLNRARLESAFRAMHTLKGSVGLFDFGPMQGVLHHAEELLSHARTGQITVDATLIDPLLAVIEWVDDSIEGILRTGHLSEVQEKQAPRLLGLLNSEITERETIEPVLSTPAIPDWAASLRQSVYPQHPQKNAIALRYEPHAGCFFDGDDPLALLSRVPDLQHVALFLKEPPPSLQNYDPFQCNLIIEAVSGGPLADVEDVFRLIPDQIKLFTLQKNAAEQAALDPELPAYGQFGRQSTTMRIDSTRIDRLIEIAGELVTAKNGLQPIINDARAEGQNVLARRVASSHIEIERLVGLLYNAVTKARMIPLEQTFRRFPRLVRETSARLGKPLDLLIEGETIEADREIVESLFEPLLHLIRNCLDHGIEIAADRLASSKPARARIQLRARQRGDQIEIAVSDDGRGINPDRVKEIAIERGLISATEASTLSERKILQFVFAPGFSTASSVSDLSGRGVGLDVVRRSVQRLGGTLDMQSVAGSGTTFTLQLPISFSMAQVMVVEVQGERYGIPMTDVIETNKLHPGSVQAVRAGRALVLRDKTVPLLYLAELLQLSIASSPPDDFRTLIVRAGDQDIALVVDQIAERAETLTRPLTGLLRGVSGIAGTTVLGDGKILLVLNLEELVQ